MSTLATARPSAGGRLLDPAASLVGELCRSDDVATDGDTLRQRLADDGYLYLPGYLDPAAVRAARRELMIELAARGWVAAGTDPEAGIAAAAPGAPYEMNELAGTSQALRALLYGSRMIELYQRIFTGQVRHFDYTWLRAVRPGGGTPPHMDAVFMNRGTPRLLTAWTPLGDIDPTLGGLAILAGSHRVADITDGYATRDVDTYCANSDDADELAKADLDHLAWNGSLDPDAVALAQRLGLRWLTADFHAGDLLTFSIVTAHTGLDNNSPDRLRLSSDSRYQPASEPADPRWVGRDPSAHGRRSKRGLIC